jgi:hypothetical protein
VASIKVGPLGYFVHIFITTPVFSALKLEKLLYVPVGLSTVEAPADI